MSIDIEHLNRDTVSSLFGVFDRIYSSNNLLILDSRLSSAINYLTPFSEFKARGRFDKVIWLDDYEPPLVANYPHVVIIAEGDEHTVEKLTALAKLSVKLNVIIRNLSKALLYQLNSRIKFTNFDAIVHSDLTTVRVNHHVKLFNWKFDGLYLYDNVISLELENGGLTSYLNEPLSQINRLNRAIINLISKYKIKFNNIYAKGDLSHLLVKLFDKELLTYLNTNFNSLQQDFYLHKYESNMNLVVVERNLDLMPLLLTQLTYHGLIDEFFPLEINLIKNNKDQIKVDDELFESLKDLNFSLIGFKLNKLAKLIKNEYSSNPNYDNLHEIKKLVVNLSDLNKQQDLIKKHTNISEQLLDTIKKGGTSKYNEHEIFLNLSNELFAMNYKQLLLKLQDLLKLNVARSVAFNILIIISILNNGIKSKDLDSLKAEFLQNYGIESILTIKNLLKYHIIRLGDQDIPDTSHVLTGGSNVYKNNYTLLDKFWNLHPEDGDDETEINRFTDYKAPSFTLPSNTVPLTVRIIEALFSREFLVYKPINKITKKPSWENLGLSNMFNALALSSLLPKMMNRVFSQRVFTRNFQASARSMNKVFGSPKEGVYSNLPFNVKRKYIPFSVYYWGVLGFFFSFPFLTTFWHLKKSGSFDM